MYLIVGLGNPENQYKNTRHNMGFDVINEIAQKYNITIEKEKYNGLYETALIEGKKVILLKPQTYMNLSGEAVKRYMEFYNITTQELIIIYDDMDIPKGQIKLRKTGGPGSHNGMKSIIENIKTKDFPRIRVGIGRPIYEFDKINYVIGQIPKEERPILDEGIKKATEAVIEIISKEIDNAMNKFNIS